MTEEENPASPIANEKKSSFDSLLGLLFRIGPSLGVTKMYLQKNGKVSAFVAVLMVAVGVLLSIYYSQTGSTKPSDAHILLSSYLGIKMDPQIRDSSDKANCQGEKTFSDLDYSLLGYDILFGYPLADGRDPGFKYPIFRADFSEPRQTSDCRYKLPQGFIVIPSQSCVVSFTSKLIRNQQQMSSHLGGQASVEGGGWGFEFSASAGFKKDSAAMQSGEHLYVISQAECRNYYSMIDFSNPPPFDPGFISKAKTLADPQTNEEAVVEFIEYFGTHFLTEVTYGAKFVQHHKIGLSTYESLKESSINVETQASYSGLFSVGGGLSLDEEQKKVASNFAKNVETTTYTVGSTPPSNGDAMTWAASVGQNPVPMLYALATIDILFTEPFIRNLPSGFDYEVARKKLKDASHLHCNEVKKNGLVQSCKARFEIKSEGLDFAESGYSYLQNIDYAACLELCRQDEKCTAVVYGELFPPSTSSVCKFFNTEHDTLRLVEAINSDPPTKTHLVILESKGKFSDATLEGRPYSKIHNSLILSNQCEIKCNETRFFCDAISQDFISLFEQNCQLYSLQDITGIAFSSGSFVTL